MEWSDVKLERKIHLLKIATDLVLMTATPKLEEVRNLRSKIRYQAEGIYGSVAWRIDKHCLFQYETIVYLLALGVLFRGDVYGYFMAYIEKADAYLRKAPARSGNEGSLDWLGEEKEENDDDD